MNSILSLTKSIASRINFDGLENVLTGLGVNGKDKRHGGIFRVRRFPQSVLEQIHDSNDIAQLVVNKPARLATKKWITHKVDKDEGGMAMANKLVDEDDRLQVKEKFRKAMAWASLYGGAGIFVSVDDGLPLDEPINVNRIRRVNSLTVLHKFELQRSDLNGDIDDPNFGMPEFYSISGRNLEAVPKVHHSRILRFQGAPLSEQGFRDNDYWNESVITLIHDIIRDYQAAYDGVFHALQDFDVDILKLRDLADICQADDSDIITARLRLMQMSKSIMSAIVVDAEGESFEKLERQFTNIDKVLDKADKRLQLATGFPHTVLFGDGSTGTLGASGESEQNTLNDMVAEVQG